jgi:hypothetical protein
MTRAVIQANIQTANGAVSVAPGASVSITISATGALATLYAAREGGSPVNNPTTADSNGFFRVYVDPGRYTITATLGSSVQTFNDVVVFADWLPPLIAKDSDPIINGDLSVWQTGDSFPAIAINEYGPDMFNRNNNNDGAVSWDKNSYGMLADGSAFCENSLKVEVTTADTTLDTDQYELIDTRIEGNRIAQFGFGQTGERYLTLSFDVRSSVAGIYCVAIRNSVASRHYVTEFTVNAVNTKERKHLTIPVDEAGTWLYRSGVGLTVSFVLASDTQYHTTADTWQDGNFLATANQVNFLGTVGNTFEITGITITPGKTPRQFTSRGHGAELALCQRYYFIRTDTGISSTDDGRVGNNITFPSKMRVTPTLLTQDITVGSGGLFGNASAQGCYQTVINSSNARCTLIATARL